MKTKQWDKDIEKGIANNMPIETIRHRTVSELLKEGEK
jgi:hypothetical protein